MDPPQRPSSLRRTTSTQNLKPLPTLDLLQDNSSEETKALRGSGKDKHITSMQVSGMEWAEPDDIISQSTTRLQVELAECVETKTVTTTTTTKRSYPPLIVRPPRSLHTLDAREYPLALKPTPRELTNFSFEIDGKIVHLCEVAPTSARSTVGGLKTQHVTARISMLIIICTGQHSNLQNNPTASSTRSRCGQNPEIRDSRNREINKILEACQ